MAATCWNCNKTRINRSGNLHCTVTNKPVTALIRSGCTLHATTQRRSA